MGDTISRGELSDVEISKEELRTLVDSATEKVEQWKKRSFKDVWDEEKQTELRELSMCDNEQLVNRIREVSDTHVGRKPWYYEALIDLIRERILKEKV